MKVIRHITAVMLVLASMASAQQVSIPRIEQMPAMPDPYVMRDWKAVATQYDSLVFDQALSGEYLPLVFLNTTTVNYPAQTSFGLHTYVGDMRSGASGEAINVLPALTGATLCGIDKRAQFGNDWVLMSREYFNNRQAENVYLNAPVAGSGSDWWYDIMPNIFFYQLYTLHPGTEDYARQFASVADRWLEAVGAMGGSVAPWSHPGLEHRGWYLASMAPNNETPYEPEAGGSIAWLLYHASRVTGEEEYLHGAELCMEELNAYTRNPAYELQLPYGALVASRMNAEIGTEFDIPKIVNWCFDVSPTRSWGAVVGKWGGLDCSGLIGEINWGNDYAFAMNTFEQIGALVPLVRYDPRFARAIGRWVLNAANASRLFYGDYLPDANQDSRAWSILHDSSSVIAYEALRQVGNGGAAPYATGDAIQGGWAPTNLSLYSSSHVGILGAIIDTTGVGGILRLDLLATDYFHAPAYPSYLFYNPDTLAHVVQVPLAGGVCDVYDAVTKQFPIQGASAMAGLTIPPGEAVVAVAVPSGGTPTYDEEKMLVNGVVVDFHSTNVPSNHRPRIKALGAESALLYLGGGTRLFCASTDRDGDTVSHEWSCAAGVLDGAGAMVTWSAPATKGSFSITCRIGDGKSGNDTATVVVTVADSALSVPVIRELAAHPGKVDLGGMTAVHCRATEPGGLPLTYSWRVDRGSFTGGDSSIQWTAPAQAGNCSVYCTVSNTQGGIVTDSVVVPVRDYSQGGSGGPTLSLPFTGSLTDASGYNNQMSQTDLIFVGDRFGTPANAAGFNGGTSCVRVVNTTVLNCDSAITVALWMKPGILSSKEMFLISHGSWQNRWKISITPEGRIRWTVKTGAGVSDIDSRTVIASGVYHHVAVTFNGSDFEIYVDGELEAFRNWSGRLLTPAIDLTVGQMLPTDANYNFQGVIDDVLVYDYALTYHQVQELFTRITRVETPGDQSIPLETGLIGVYPNPFNPKTVVSSQLSAASNLRLVVYDLLGREVAVLMDEYKPAGTYRAGFDGSELASGVYICRMSAGEYAGAWRMLLLK